MSAIDFLAVLERIVDERLSEASARDAAVPSTEADSHGANAVPPASTVVPPGSLTVPRSSAAAASSYTARLASQGVAKVAQKVGEEGVETALAAAVEPVERLTEEAADLLYHLIVLLRLRGLRLADVADELERRHAARR